MADLAGSRLEIVTIVTGSANSKVSVGTGLAKIVGALLDHSTEVHSVAFVESLACQFVVRSD